MDRMFMFMEKNCPQGLSAPARAIYIYMTIFYETAWPIKAKLYVEHR